jgi:hypothetical protein
MIIDEKNTVCTYTFSVIFEFLKIGRMATNISWNNSNLLIGAFYVLPHPPYLYMTVCGEFNGQYNPTQIDLFSDKWVLV